MKHILTIIFWFSIIYSYGQVDPIDKLVLSSVLENVRGTEQVVYTDRADRWVWDKLKIELEKVTFVGITEDTKSNTITLSKEEQEYIIKQIAATRYLLWPDNMFENSKRIKLDSMWAFIEQENSNLEQLKSRKPLGVFTFSKPIYLRGKSICILYTRRMLDLNAGTQEISFYKMDKDKWINWIVISSGAW
jgi:hypothetical protein